MTRTLQRRGDGRLSGPLPFARSLQRLSLPLSTVAGGNEQTTSHTINPQELITVREVKAGAGVCRDSQRPKGNDKPTDTLP